MFVCERERERQRERERETERERQREGERERRKRERERESVCVCVLCNLGKTSGADPLMQSMAQLVLLGFGPTSTEAVSHDTETEGAIRLQRALLAERLDTKTAMVAAQILFYGSTAKRECHIPRDVGRCKHRNRAGLKPEIWPARRGPTKADKESGNLLCQA